jgi:hypothetical protein
MSFNLEDQFHDAYQTDTRSKSKSPTIDILIMNSSSKLNKDLLKFFDKNLDVLVKNGMVFNWIVVYDDEEEIYERQNITEFPMMVDKIKKRKIAGTSTIIEELRARLSAKKNQPTGVASQNDTLNDYLLQELNNTDDHDDENESDRFSRTLTARTASMHAARAKAGQHASKTSNPELHDQAARSASRSHGYGLDSAPRRQDNIVSAEPTEVLRQTGDSNDMDDKLMMGYWENQETTL